MINQIDRRVSDQYIYRVPSLLKHKIVEQAASMLLNHLTYRTNSYHIYQANSNGNAFDEYRKYVTSSQSFQKRFKRADKCHSWLSKYLTRSDTSLNQSATLVKSHINQNHSHDYSSKIAYDNYQKAIHNNTFENFNNENNLNFLQPMIMVHKKRVHRDYFLSKIQNCIEYPYSQNHFYAFDRTNMLKLQRNFHSFNNKKIINDDREMVLNLKRKYANVENDENENNDKVEYFKSDKIINQTSQLKKSEHSLPKTVDCVSLNRYFHEQNNDHSLNNQKPDQSNIIISHLEKILNLCGELRSLAKDVEHHLNEQSNSKTISSDTNEKSDIRKTNSEQTIIDIYKEIVDDQPTKQDVQKDDSLTLPCQHTNDGFSIHSETNQSHQFVQTESSKTKTLSPKMSYTTVRKSEEICSCFLKSYLENTKCELTDIEQEFLNELTKAYLLGREQTFKEQQLENMNYQSSKPDQSLTTSETNNNNNNQLNELQFNDSMVILEEKSSDVLTMKHQLFLNEPIAMKTTSVLPGIGAKYAQQLSKFGFSTVRRLLGFYLMIKDDQHFAVWLNNKIGVSTHSAWLCTNALRDWCRSHI